MFGWYRRLAARRFYGGLIDSGDLCIEVGANTGDKTAVLLSLGARVVAVEPQPVSVGALKRRFDQCDRLTVVEAAAGDEPGAADLMISNESQVSTFSQEFIDAYRRPGIRWDQRQRVRVTTLDELIREHGEPAYVALDVEGFEEKVLAGLTAPVGLVSFEFNARLEHLARRCVSILGRLGPARFNFTAFEQPRFELEDWVDSHSMTSVIGAMPESILTGYVFARFGIRAPTGNCDVVPRS